MSYSLVPVLVALLSVGSANASTRDICPILPTSSGVSWQIEHGPDFDVCRAIRDSDKKESFGVYMGNHPWFKLDSSAKKLKGVVGGNGVTWQSHSPSPDNPIALETLVSLPPTYPQIPVFAHVWLPALSRTDAQQALALLVKIQFRTWP